MKQKSENLSTTRKANNALMHSSEWVAWLSTKKTLIQINF